jgi:hypothetical protein
VAYGNLTLSPGTRIKAAMTLAVLADTVQIFFLPMFMEGAASPADDMLDLGIGGLMVYLLGWHWEFMPSFLGKLVPGVDLVPLWTLAVANVYRKSRRTQVTTGTPVTIDAVREDKPAPKDARSL